MINKNHEQLMQLPYAQHHQRVSLRQDPTILWRFGQYCRNAN